MQANAEKGLKYLIIGLGRDVEDVDSAADSCEINVSNIYPL